MLRSMKDLEDYAIQATDGKIGHVKDFYFDDSAWVIRYFVVDTGTWLASRKVLISPIAISTQNRKENLLSVAITKQQVENSPSIDTEKPVSRQHEISLLDYYGYPGYWGGIGLWGANTYPGMMMPGYDGSVAVKHAESFDREMAYKLADAAEHRDDDLHLRSCKALKRYHIMASDGDIGHVDGMLVDEETWAIRYLIVKTSNWWIGQQVLIAPQWIKKISWSGATVSVSLSRQAVKDAPPYDPDVLLNREEELKIHEHYSQPPYRSE
ncbi:PRC-barrel domain-containing protein [Zhongshania sp.]|jgi:hypothetical protein|uniref:PRC-barrel domain-containing protein n=1 Tax=Zhongshania sp. TaxID=1971902 RepID=UPI002A83A9F1|nr:PRC-barrel domain-containing protein [Zhongshania sp.]